MHNAINKERHSGGDSIPRKPRIWYPGAKYHIMNRGNRRTTIFQDDEDYQTFLFFLTTAQEKFPFFLISYCLMTNHIHLQIETITHQPGKIMQYILTNYSNYYNTKYGYIGHLFQGRYQGEIIDNDAYMLQTSRYIHLNPVKAKIVEKPAEYKWSSYCVFIGKSLYDLVSEYKILDYFAGDKRSKIKHYKDYVEGELIMFDQVYNDEVMSGEVIRFEERVVEDGDPS